MATETTAVAGRPRGRSSRPPRRATGTPSTSSCARTYVDTYTLAVRLTANEEDARDVVQEAYLRAWKGIRHFRGDAQFSTWMYRITANAAATLIEQAPPPAHRDPHRRRRRPDRDAGRAPARARRRDRRALSRALGRARPSCRRAADARGAQGRVRPLPRGDRRGAGYLGHGGEGAPAPRPQAAARPALRGGGRHAARCDDIAVLLPAGGRRRRAGGAPGAAPHRVLPAVPGRARPLPPDAARAAAPAHPVPRADPGAARGRRSPASPRRASAGPCVDRSPGSASPTRVRSAGAVAAAGATTAAVLVPRARRRTRSPPELLARTARPRPVDRREFCGAPLLS